MNFILFYLYIVFGYSFKFLNIIRTTSNRIMNKKINIVLYNSYFLLEFSAIGYTICISNRRLPEFEILSENNMNNNDSIDNFINLYLFLFIFINFFLDFNNYFSGSIFYK